MDDRPPNLQSAFEQAMLPHLDAAYNLAHWLLRHEHDARDAVQDAFMRAHRAFGRFAGTDGRAWLLTIVRNVCYTRLRERRRQVATEVFDDEAHGGSVDRAEVNAVSWREVRSELLGRALAELAPEFREVLILHELEGLTYRQISEIAAIPIGTVMSRLTRARQKLQSAIAQLNPNDAPSHGL